MSVEVEGNLFVTMIILLREINIFGWWVVMFQASPHNDDFNKKRTESNIWFWITSKHRWGQSMGNSKATITTKIKIISNLEELGSGNSELNSNAKQTSIAVI